MSIRRRLLLVVKARHGKKQGKPDFLDLQYHRPA